jgi:hypothetical protein
MSDVRINLDGLLAILYGLPALAFACGVIAVLFVFPTHRFLKITAMALAIPALLLGIGLIPDALSLPSHGKIDAFNWVWLAAYFTLLGLLPYLLYRQITRKPPVQ